MTCLRIVAALLLTALLALPVTAAPLELPGVSSIIEAADGLFRSLASFVEEIKRPDAAPQGDPEPEPEAGGLMDPSG